jgi:hypothetical protein
MKIRLLPIASSAVILLAGLAAGDGVLAQQSGGRTQQSRIDDRRLGEEEQILRRHQWFFETRRPGTTSDVDLARLRRIGAEATRQAILQQRLRRADGIESTQNFWVSLGPSPSNFGGWAFGTVSGRVSSIAADFASGTLWVGTASGGLWKSTNDGLSWTNTFDSVGTMTVGTVAVDPNDPNVVWAGTGENNQGCESYFGIGLLRSDDGGATWQPRNGSGATSLDEMASFANVIVDPRDSNHVITGGRIRGCGDGSATNGGIFTTDDGGLTWTERLADRQVYEIAQDPAVLDVWWAGTSEGVFKSTDNGVTWTLQTASGLPSGSPGRTEIAIAPSDGNTVYALFSGGPSFWRTTDGGASWTQMSSGSAACDGQCTYNMVVRVHNTDPNTVYRGTVHVFKSLDGGANWTDLSNNWGSSQKVHQDTHHFLMDPNNSDTFWVGCDGGVWKSIDGGASFLNRNGNLNVTQFYAIGVEWADPGTVCGGAQDNSSLARTTSDTWDLQAVTGDGFVCHFNPQDENYAYITSYPSGGFPNVWRSTTGVLGSFSDISGSGSGIISGDRSNWVTPYILDPASPSTLYLGTHRVYRSDNYGSSWTQVGPGDLTAGSGSLLSLEVNRGYPDVVYSGSVSGRIWRSANRGDDFTDITSGLPSSRSINDISGDPTNPDRAFAVLGGFNTDHVWEWNAGTGWTARSEGLPNVPTNTVLMLTDTDLMIGTDTGIFRSYDGGVTWQPYMDGFPEGVPITDLKFNPEQSLVTAGTYGRGAWQVSIDPVDPIVVFDSIELPMVEIDGDGDGNVEPGETWQVRPILRNAGGETALGVQARLVTSTPGITIEGSSLGTWGDISPGAPQPPASPFTFIVDPTITCGETVVFDILDVTSTNPPNAHADRLSAFTVDVTAGNAPPIPTTRFDDDFDPNPEAGWTHESFNPGIIMCYTFPFFDEWHVNSKDAAHGSSYHAGTGPGGSYGVRNYAWLYYGGKDSTNGPGIDIPANSVSATLTLVHWYDTALTEDGGQVAVDGVEDDQDVYATLDPVGGYPNGLLDDRNCNGLGGQNAFHGSSGGWVTSTFDLLQYAGKKIYLAFIFGSDNRDATGEGWYIDQVTIETEEPGVALCDVIEWPGSVPANVSFDLVSPGMVEAAWSDACNLATTPGQTYSVQAGDLDALHAAGTYSHAPVGDQCGHVSPVSFAHGAGNEYYLVVPNEGGREGGGGLDSAGASRPQGSGVCGPLREAACP